MSHGNKIKINYKCSLLKLLEAAKCKQTCRTGRNKISQICVKEHLPKALLFLPKHDGLLSFPGEMTRKRKHKRDHYRDHRWGQRNRDLAEGIYYTYQQFGGGWRRGGETVLGRFQYVLPSSFLHLLLPMLLSILLCQGVCVVLQPCKSVDLKRENTISKDFSEIITDCQGDNLIVGDETGTLEKRK